MDLHRAFLVYKLCCSVVPNYFRVKKHASLLSIPNQEDTPSQF